VTPYNYFYLSSPASLSAWDVGLGDPLNITITYFYWALGFMTPKFYYSLATKATSALGFVTP
jgi:hypothetical protein